MYLAENFVTKQQSAVKLFKGETAVDHEEIERTYRLDHENLVRAIDHGKDFEWLLPEGD